MDDNDIAAIAGWPTEPEMVKFRRIAAAASAAERNRLVLKLMAQAKEAHDAGAYSKRDELSAAAGWVLKA